MQPAAIAAEPVRTLDKVFIDGAFRTPHGADYAELFDPSTEHLIGRLRLGDQDDARQAIAAARRAFAMFSRTTVKERVAMLRRMSEAMQRRVGELGKV